MNKSSSIEADKDIKWIDYVVVFLLLSISGSPLVSSLTQYIYILSVVLFLFLSVTNKTAVLTKRFICVGTALVLLYSLQFVFVRDVSLQADVNRFAIIYSGFLAVTIVGYKFRYVYLRVMMFVCTVSLVGFSANFVIGQFPGITVGRTVSILIYNYYPISTLESNGLRNCGMFWEPGAFQGYIMLSFIMFMDDFRGFYQRYKLSFFVMTIALITTFSTTGYVVFTLYLFIVFFEKIKESPMMLVLMIVLALGAIWAFSEFDFLGEKIMNEYEDAQNLNAGDVSWSRTGSALIAWDNILKHPLIGNGFLMSAQYGSLSEEMSGMGNGFFGAMNQFGILFIAFYLHFLYMNAPANGKLYRWAFVLLVVLMLNGEFFLNYPMFWALMFVRIQPNEIINII